MVTMSMRTRRTMTTTRLQTMSTTLKICPWSQRPQLAHQLLIRRAMWTNIHMIRRKGLFQEEGEEVEEEAEEEEPEGEEAEVEEEVDLRTRERGQQGERISTTCSTELREETTTRLRWQRAVLK